MIMYVINVRLEMWPKKKNASNLVKTHEIIQFSENTFTLQLFHMQKQLARKINMGL